MATGIVDNVKTRYGETPEADANKLIYNIVRGKPANQALEEFKKDSPFWQESKVGGQYAQAIPNAVQAVLDRTDYGASRPSPIASTEPIASNDEALKGRLAEILKLTGYNGAADMLRNTGGQREL